MREFLSVNPFANTLWHSQPTVNVHPDGDRRKLNLPFEQGPQVVEIAALTPMRADDMRMIILVPVGQPGAAGSTRSTP